MKHLLLLLLRPHAWQNSQHHSAIWLGHKVFLLAP
jgi:hypothetical protein